MTHRGCERKSFSQDKSHKNVWLCKDKFETARYGNTVPNTSHWHPQMIHATAWIQFKIEGTKFMTTCRDLYLSESNCFKIFSKTSNLRVVTVVSHGDVCSVIAELGL